MADPIYGLQQAQPKDVYNFMRANSQPLDLVGRFEYLPFLIQKVENGDNIGLLDGLEMIISDSVQYYDEPMLNGQTRRYARIRAFMGTFGTFGRSARETVAEAITNLGYTKGEIIFEYESGLEYTNALGVRNDAIDGANFTGGILFEFRAGAPRYMFEDSSLMDAPHDGREYVRVDGDWVLSDHFVHSNVDGGEATIDSP